MLYSVKVGKFIRKHKNRLTNYLLWVLVVSLFTSISNFAPLKFSPTPARAAQITIYNNLFASRSKYNASPQVVWVSDTTVYAFYITEDGDCPAYVKSTDAGANWSAETDLATDQDWATLAVWYDRWTPNDNTGTKIYLAAQETSGTNDDDLNFKILDTSDDSVSPAGTTWTKIDDGTADYTVGTNGQASITKSTDGYLFAVGAATGSIDVRKSTDSGANWADSTSGLDAVGDFNQLLPLSEGDILLLNHDVSAGTGGALRQNVYDEGTDAWGGFSNIAGTFVENTTYDGSYGAR